MFAPGSGIPSWDVTDCTVNLQIRTGITAALWSILLVLFLINSHIIVTRSGRPRKDDTVLLVLMITFVVATVEFGLNIGNIASQTPSRIRHPSNMRCIQNDPTFLRVPMMMQMFIGDAFTAYRTWLLWDRKIIVAIVPILLLVILGGS
ncbi:hypothetical protein SISSUDRAFT_1037839 [Sistotremastrum suecicum HHB10207 ss-3]|uniref:Uncharacterized protein n=1 Tax=Sistotremastrum suecicum HHB10207 ss-3 TaxID=1314776 RepID=A0A165XKK0_9AGAM|nr:hypothetical protein SISSUDRAFT_1037839 [Sistotremastrum suecicum HHB10207 ss-3]